MNTATALLFFVLLSPAGTSTPARVALTLQAPQAINAIEASVAVPQGVSIERIEDAGSIVSYWIEAPHQDDAGMVQLAGVMPSGYSGTGPVVILDVASSSSGTLSIAAAQAYLDGPHATPAPLATSSLTLSPPAPWWATPWPYILIVVLAGLWLWRHLRVRII